MLLLKNCWSVIWFCVVTDNIILIELFWGNACIPLWNTHLYNIQWFFISCPQESFFAHMGAIALPLRMHVLAQRGIGWQRAAARQWKRCSWGWLCRHFRFLKAQLHGVLLPKPLTANSPPLSGLCDDCLDAKPPAFTVEDRAWRYPLYNTLIALHLRVVQGLTYSLIYLISH